MLQALSTKLKCIIQTFLIAIFILGMDYSANASSSSQNALTAKLVEPSVKSTGSLSDFSLRSKILLHDFEKETDFTCSEVADRYWSITSDDSQYIGRKAEYKDFFTKKAVDEAVVNNLLINFNAGKFLFSKKEIKKIKSEKKTNLISDLLVNNCSWYNTFFKLYSKKLTKFNLWFNSSIVSGHLNSDLHKFISTFSSSDIEKLEKKLEKKWMDISLAEATSSKNFPQEGLKNIKNFSDFEVFKILRMKYNAINSLFTKHPYKKYTKEVILAEVIFSFKEAYLPANNKLKYKHHFYLSAIIGSLDAHSHYTKLEKETRGNFRNNMGSAGLGIGIACFLEVCLVTEILEKGASVGKLKVGDLIISANSVQKKGLSTKNFISEHLKGTKGSKTSLKILRLVDNKEQLLNIFITRALTQVDRFDSKILSNKTAYIKLKSFYGATNGFNSSSEDFISALADLDPQAESLIIDLQNNPGGIVKEVVNILAALLLTSERAELLPLGDDRSRWTCGKDLSREGIKEERQIRFTGEILINSSGERPMYIMPLVTYFAAGATKPKSVFYCNRKPYFFGKPIVVLINKNSASASEILSLGLKEAGVALIVGGKQTYGKGSGQMVILENSLGLTIFLWGSFLGTSIQFKGVKSDIVLNLSKKEKSFNISKYEKDLPRALPVIGDIGSPWPENVNERIHAYYKYVQKQMQEALAIPLGKLSQTRQKEIRKKFSIKTSTTNLAEEEKENIKKSVIQEAINILQDWKNIIIKVYNSQEKNKI